MNHSHQIKIAIDGPAGAGKSSVAKVAAEKLGYVYVDTGAMYRARTWYGLEHTIKFEDTPAIEALLKSVELTLKSSADGQRILVNDEDITAKIRSSEVTQHVSQIAQISSVRRFLTAIQKQLSVDGGIVMDGRDIGTEVMPDAELKIFLTASVQERARRRFAEMQASGIEVSMEQLIQDIANRDRMDEQREESPLRQAEDAIYLDCTTLSMNQVVDRIVELCISKVNEAKA